MTAIRDRDLYLQVFFSIFMAVVTGLGFVAVVSERSALKSLREENSGALRRLQEENSDNWKDLTAENRWNWQRLEDETRRLDHNMERFGQRVSTELEKTTIQVERLDHMISSLEEQERNAKADMMAIKSLVYIRLLSQRYSTLGDAVLERIGTEVAKILGEIKPLDPQLLAETYIHDSWVKNDSAGPTWPITLRCKR